MFVFFFCLRVCEQKLAFVLHNKCKNIYKKNVYLYIDILAIVVMN